MSLTVLIGGARSGKSTLATSIAETSGSEVFFIATAEARDEEMKVRIAAHRLARPSSWTTIEEPLDLEAALSRPPDDALVIIDCLTLWISNLLEHETSDDAVLQLAEGAAAIAADRGGRSLAITNDVGSGIVPVNALARRYRDLLGMVNARWCARANDAFLMVAGRALVLADPSTLADRVNDA